MPDPKGRLFTPVGFRADGSIHALSLDNNDRLQVAELTHALLDGTVNNDTVAGAPAKGDVIVGITQGDATIKWQKLARGSTGQALVVQADGSLAWQAASSKFVQNVYSLVTGVATGTTAIPFDDTIPQITEGDQYLTITITPGSAINILHFSVVLFGAVSTTQEITAALFKSGVSDALKAVAFFTPAVNGVIPLHLEHYMVAGATGALTFTVRAGPSASGTFTLNGNGGARKFGGVAGSYISVDEYLP